MNESYNEIIDQIREAGRSMEQVLTSAPADQLLKRPEQEAWSIAEIAYHVRNVASLAYGLRIRRLIYESDPIFPDYDDENELVKALNSEQPVEVAAAMIRSEYDLVADLLALLPEGAWQRSGRHPESGVMSIEFLARRLIEHAREHEAQIQETVRMLAAIAD